MLLLLASWVILLKIPRGCEILQISPLHGVVIITIPFQLASFHFMFLWSLVPLNCMLLLTIQVPIVRINGCGPIEKSNIPK